MTHHSTVKTCVQLTFCYLYLLISSYAAIGGGLVGSYRVMSVNDPCTIAVRLQDTVTMACQYVHAQDIVPGTVSATVQQCAIKTVRWRRLELPRRQFANLTASGKFTTWSSEQAAVDEVRRVNSASIHSTVSFLRVINIRETDLLRYRCEIDCQVPAGRHATHQNEAVICQRHQGASDYQLCPIEVYNVGGFQRCDVTFGDGLCDVTCDVEQTLFDGFDCVESESHQSTTGSSTRLLHHAAAISCGAVDALSSRGGRVRPASGGSNAATGASMIEVKCRRSFADGICDGECDNAPCSWDGGDCINKALRLTEDALMLNWSLDASHGQVAVGKSPPTTSKLLARSVSRLLRSVVRLVNDDWPSTAEDAISPTSDVTKKGAPVIPSDEIRQPRTTLVRIDNTNCAVRCFSTARSAAKFVSAALNKGWNVPGFVISSVAVVERVDEHHRCAFNNSSASGASTYSRDASLSSTRHSDLAVGGRQEINGASTSLPSVGTLFWVVIVAAIGGTVVVLLIAAVVLLIRQVCRVRRPVGGSTGRRRQGRRSGGASTPAVSGEQRGGGGGGGKAVSSVPLSACPSTEADTASSVYCWNDLEPSPGGPGAVGLLAPLGNGASASLVPEPWPTASPRHHRHGTDV